jgi:hypothetical protein
VSFPVSVSALFFLSASACEFLQDVPSNPSFLDSIRRDIRLDSFAQDLVNHIDPDRASSKMSKSSLKDYRQFS